MFIGSLRLKNLFITLVISFALTSSVFASTNVISSVLITKAKHGMGGYELNIDSTKPVQYKSHIDGNGNVYFDLKNSTLIEGLGTIYDDVSDIDNVSVKQMENNKVRIYVNGKDAKETELIFVNSVFDSVNEASKKVTINRPISEYKSTTYHNNDLETQDEIQEWDDNSFNFAHLTTTLLSELKNNAIGKVSIILLFIGILCIMIKMFAVRLIQDREPLIGLNAPKVLNNDLGLGTSVISSMQLNNKEPKIQTSNREQALKQAQIELSKAHQKYQQYLQNKYQNNYKPKSVDVDAIRKSIALNQYQKSTQNPYKGQEVLKMNKDFTSEIQPQGNYQIPPRPKMQPKKEFSSPYIQRTNKFVNPQIKQPSKSNLNFLESVTKIYENSGRGDLASGLKNSISKAKQTI